MMKKLKKLGMHALLVERKYQRIISCNNGMEWSEKYSKPLAFVGKGVCFDTGGYSLKPARFMEDIL